jgi:hypothetical protein
MNDSSQINNLTSDNLTSDNKIYSENDMSETPIDSLYLSVGSKTYSHADKKMLVKRMSNIKNKKCYIKILHVILDNDLKHQILTNGVYFNLTKLPDDILNKIEVIIKYYENKKNESERLLKTNNKHFNETLNESFF